MRVLSIDPDPHGGSWVLLDRAARPAGFHLKAPMSAVCATIHAADHVVVEDFQSYGMGFPLGSPTI